MNSGMASLQSFQPSADRFCSWLTRIEETAAKLESDGEKLRAKYGAGDQSLPVEELKPFKVGKPCKGFLWVIHKSVSLNIFLTPPPLLVNPFMT